MAHDHHHDHDAGSYYVGQLCMVGICGALAGVAVVLWLRGGLWFLAPKFQQPVLLGGLALLALVAIRALSIWFSPARPHTHTHDHHHHDHDHAHEHHDHDHADCGHAHSHEHSHAVTAVPSTPTHALNVIADAPPPAPVLVHTHDHGHDHTHDDGHDHGWAPWRYVVLLLPIVLFFLNLPNQGFSSHYGAAIKAEDLEEGTVKQIVHGDGSTANVTNVTFMELDQAANSPQLREQREGEWVRIKGQFVPSTSNKRFSLVRFKINCCAADAIRLNMVIDCAQELNVASFQGQWVEVTGQVSFRKIRGREEYITVLSVPAAKDVKRVDADPNPFVY